MYMKTCTSSLRAVCLLGLALSLSGCSTPGSLKPEPVVVSEPCLDMAKYARAIRFLLEAGIPVQELDLYVKVPVAVQVPMYSLQAQVYASNFSTPAEAYNTVLNQCTSLGWQSMLSFLGSKFPRLSLKPSLKLSNSLRSN